MLAESMENPPPGNIEAPGLIGDVDRESLDIFRPCLGEDPRATNGLMIVDEGDFDLAGSSRGDITPASTVPETDFALPLDRLEDGLSESLESCLLKRTRRRVSLSAEPELRRASALGAAAVSTCKIGICRLRLTGLDAVERIAVFYKCLSRLPD